jgi:drug/metabolite transporter (DMT)-like permease
MFLGTPRRWWIASGVLLAIGIVLVATGKGGTWGTAGGVVLLLAAMVVFAAAPMRYGQAARSPQPEPAAPPAAPEPAAPPRPRAAIEARDASEV